MSTAEAATPSAAASDVIDAGAVLRRWRLPLAVLAGLLAVSVLLALAAASARRGFLDPDAVDERGSRALATLLREQGVDVVEARTTDEAVAAAEPGSTLLVTVPDLLLPEEAARVTGTGADLVLVQPTASLPGLTAGIEATGPLPESDREPGCSLPFAQRAGSVLLAGTGYTGGRIGCYADGGAAGLVLGSTPTGDDVVVIGDPAPLTNAGLDEGGSAALAMGLLGGRERLVWFRPSVAALTGSGASPTDLLPGWVRPAFGAVALAWLLLVAWRARRLGPLVTEPLPVVVRAAETTEGRARLYRRGRARGRAADALRDASAARLARRLGRPRASRTELVPALAARTGRPDADVAALIDGPAPTDDAALVRLATDLDALEDEVSRS